MDSGDWTVGKGWWTAGSGKWAVDSGQGGCGHWTVDSGGGQGALDRGQCEVDSGQWAEAVGRRQ